MTNRTGESDKNNHFGKLFFIIKLGIKKKELTYFEHLKGIRWIKTKPQVIYFIMQKTLYDLN